MYKLQKLYTILLRIGGTAKINSTSSVKKRVPIFQEEQTPLFLGVDLAKGKDQSTVTTWKGNKIVKIEEI